jgi:3(or 17)beta-hydroxysteroid dehydrogenase
MNLTKRLEGKVALITGAASGLGAASARRLHREGAFVVVTDRDVEKGAAVAASIGEGAVFHKLDVTSEAEWIAVIDAVVAAHGGLDVLVNNAGVGVLASIEDTSLEAFRFVHAVNTEGVFLGCKHGVRVMKARGGSIINMSSVAGIAGAPEMAAYCSSKGAVRTLTKSVAMHCARKGYGIRCNSLHPAFIDTPMVDAVVNAHSNTERARAGLVKSIPLGRLGEGEDVAAAVAYLASDDAKFVTGVELPIDGGLLAQ